MVVLTDNIGGEIELWKLHYTDVNCKLTTKLNALNYSELRCSDQHNHNIVGGLLWCIIYNNRIFGDLGTLMYESHPTFIPLFPSLLIYVVDVGICLQIKVLILKGS